jgi:hypothetical protein
VAKPADAEGWAAYVEQELSDALKQGNEDARKRGIGVVMRKDGSIIRRGLGQPEWREVRACVRVCVVAVVVVVVVMVMGGGRGSGYR